MLSATCLLCAVAFSLFTAHADDPNDELDSGLMVTCKCSFWNSDCKAKNGGSVCGGGDNFDCSTLNTNC